MPGSFAALLLVALLSADVRQPVCPPTPPSPGAPAWFEFQVEKPAQFMREGSRLPFPDATLNQRAPLPADFALVQFVVDTSGVPSARSFRILVRPDGLVADSVAAALASWRYQPAMARGCRVPQLVQSALRWK